MGSMETESFDITPDEYLEDLEDLQDAIMVAKNILSGKEETISFEVLKKGFGLVYEG